MDEATLLDRNATVEDMFDLVAPIKLVMARLVPSSPTGEVELSPIDISEDDDLPGGDDGGDATAGSPSPSSSAITVIKIGRSKDLPMHCKILSSRVSTIHCEIHLDHKSKLVYLVDVSTNGTFVNGTRVAKKKPITDEEKRATRVQLSTGDKISLLNPTTPEGDTILFTFQHLRPSLVEKARLELEAEDKAKKAVATAGEEVVVVKKEGGLNEDDVEEELQCSISKSLLYKPVMALPCLHTFSAHCISEWIKSGKKNCPVCNAPMTELRPAHKLRNLVDNLVKAKPELDLSDEEKKEYDKVNVIPAEGKKLVGTATKHNRDDDDDWEDDFDDDDDEYDDDDDDDGAPHPGFGFGGGGGGFGFGGGAAGGGGGGFGFGHHAAAPPMMLPGFAKMMAMPAAAACAQCHTPNPDDGFQCPPGQAHIACKMCHQVYPDRPLCEVKQRCELCNVPYCDLYLGGCKMDAGVGYLQPVKDHDLGEGLTADLPSGTLFGGNSVEIGILRNYITSAGVTPKDLWKICLREFKKAHGVVEEEVAAAVDDDDKDDGDEEGKKKEDVGGGGGGVGGPEGWIPEGTTFVKEPTPSTVVCRPCCQRIWAGLLFHYRRSIPRDALPPAIAARPNCWYGLSCKTQKHNAVHAQNYNHVCPNVKAKE